MFATIKIAGLYIMAIFFTYAGISHFTKERFFIKSVPPYIPFPKEIVLISGVAEIIFGIGLLFPLTRAYAAWGIILLLIAVFPANLYMATSGKFTAIPQILLWIRLPLQLVLIWWAYQYTK